MNRLYDPELPATLPVLTDALSRGGWDYRVDHRKSLPGVDGTEYPYVHVEAARDGRHINVMWDTRAAGTYRVASVLIDRQRSSTFKAALATAREEP